MNTEIAPSVIADDLRDAIERNGVDFLDFGSKFGGSMNFGRRVFDGQRGLGIELQAERAAKAAAEGYLVLVVDATKVAPPKNCVSFSLLVHFLEHMPSYAAAEKCIASALHASRDFVYMRHPWFDSDGELLRLGYKLYWSDWRVHTIHFNTLDFVKAIQHLGVQGRWVIMGARRIKDTRSDALVPADAPVNSHRADPIEAASRSPVKFRSPVFHETACLIQTDSLERFQWARSRLDEKHVTLIEGSGRTIIDTAQL